jgi:uncharacterized integral membrane protein
MKTLTTLIAATLVATWIGGIAILAVQNFSTVRLRFLAVQLFEMPLGLVLAFSVGIGMVGAAIAPLVLSGSMEREED